MLPVPQGVPRWACANPVTRARPAPSHRSAALAAPSLTGLVSAPAPNARQEAIAQARGWQPYQEAAMKGISAQSWRGRRRLRQRRRAREPLSQFPSPALALRPTQRSLATWMRARTAAQPALQAATTRRNTFQRVTWTLPRMGQTHARLAAIIWMRGTGLAAARRVRTARQGAFAPSSAQPERSMTWQAKQNKPHVSRARWATTALQTRRFWMKHCKPSSRARRVTTAQVAA